MHELDDKQWDELRQLHKLASVANMEVDAALYSDSLDDALTAIKAVVTATEALSLPDDLAQSLKGMALEALQAADGGSDTQNSATQAMSAVDRIEQTIRSHFASGGRRP